MTTKYGVLVFAALACGGSTAKSSLVSSPPSSPKMAADAGPSDANAHNTSARSVQGDTEQGPVASTSTVVAVGADAGAIMRAHVVPAQDPGVRGSLAKQEIKAVVRRHLPRIRYCYETMLAKEPTLAGRVEVSFTISPTGAVSEAKVEGFAEKNTEECIVAAIKRMTFPPPEGGGIVIVRYPFHFQPTHDKREAR